MTQNERWLWIILLVYAGGFLAFPPSVLLINDEERYVSQAVAFARGGLTIPDAALPGTREATRVLSDYPPATSALQAPLVAAAGWRAAAGLSVIALALMVWCTMRTLKALRFDPTFGALALIFAPALFFGRSAMSDVPAAAVVAAALWSLVRSMSGSARWAFAAGALSGGTLLFREPVILLVAPLALAAMREPGNRVPMIAGGILAIAIRAAASAVLFGDPLHVRDSGYGFSVWSMPINAPLYAMILMLLFPGGLVLVARYRGAYRWPLLAGVIGYVALFLAFEYNAWRDNGVVRGTLLAGRYMIPAVPLLVVMAAGTLSALAARVAPRTKRIARSTLLTSAAAAAFLVHPALRSLESQQYSILRFIQDLTRPEFPVVMNEKVAGKYLSPAYGSRLRVSRSEASSRWIAICQRHGGVQVVLVDRTDTELFRADAAANATFFSNVRQTPGVRLLADSTFSPSLRVRILWAGDCRAQPQPTLSDAP